VKSSDTVFILGSGFSRAFSDAMPTVAELTDRLRDISLFHESPYDGLLDNPELLLSYLDLAQPWKAPEEILRDRAVFVEAQNALAETIEDSEAQAFESLVPEWAASLVRYLCRRRATVITLNYDTVIERCVALLKDGQEKGTWPREFDLYGLPLSPLRSRSAGTLGRAPIKSFQLVKLHGSINWFYSGVDGFPGEHIYYRNVTSDSPRSDDWGRGTPSSDAQIRQLEMDKIPLIIPPVAEKSRFYSNRTVQAVWALAREALADAQQVILIGYSLPSTDLTMTLFLRSVACPASVIIVNKPQEESQGRQPILDRYREAFPKSVIDSQTFVCENSVQKMTEHLLDDGLASPSLSG